MTSNYHSGSGFVIRVLDSLRSPVVSGRGQEDKILALGREGRGLESSHGQPASLFASPLVVAAPS